MSDDNRAGNAAAEWRLAQNFLAASAALAGAGMWDRATSQLYYALFHAVAALLLTEGIEARTHRGTRHLLNVHFVVPGRIERDAMDILQDLQGERESADYAVTYPNDRSRFETYRARAMAAFQTIHGLLARAGAQVEPLG